MSYSPKKGSFRDILCRWIATKDSEGGVTMDEAAKHFQSHSYSMVSSAIFTLKHLGALAENEGVYQLSGKVRGNYGLDVPVVEAPVPELKVRAFKPWSGKFSFANAPRREPIRDGMSFMSGSAGFQIVGYRI